MSAEVATCMAVDGHLKVLKGRAAFCDERALQTLQGSGKPVSLKGADAVQLHSFRKSGGAGGGHTWYLAAGTHSKGVLADWLAQVQDGQLVCLQSSSSGTPQYMATIVDGSRGIQRLPAAKRHKSMDALADAAMPQGTPDSQPSPTDIAQGRGTANGHAAAPPSTSGLSPSLPPEVLSVLNAAGERMAAKVTQLREEYDAAAARKRQAQHALNQHDATMAAVAQEQEQRRQKRARLLEAVAELDEAIAAGAVTVQRLEAQKVENEQAMQGLAEQEAAAKQAMEEYVESLASRVAAVE